MPFNTTLFSHRVLLFGGSTPPNAALQTQFLTKHSKQNAGGYGSKLIRQRTAGFSPCFHLQGQPILGLPYFAPQPDGKTVASCVPHHPSSAEPNSFGSAARGKRSSGGTGAACRHGWVPGPAGLGARHGSMALVRQVC